MAVGERVTAVVPTIGESPLLWASLKALRRDGGDGLEIVVVWQGRREPWPELGQVANKVEVLDGNRGFAAATNRGIEVTHRELVATVNDDALVDDGWLAALVEAVDRDPRIAAVQGVNRVLDDPTVTDGCGIEWSREWQALQIRHGRPLPRGWAEREIFGVSATAAVLRRTALEVAARDGAVFDPRLDSYYEDVELACRLRVVGYLSLLVPAATASHAGSVTGRRLGPRRAELIHRNRLLVLAQALGDDYTRHLPLIVRRDVKDMLRALGRLDPATALAVLRAWRGARRRIDEWARRGEPAPALAVFERFREVV